MPKPVKDAENMTLAEVRERLDSFEQVKAENRDLKRKLAQIARLSSSDGKAS